MSLWGKIFVGGVGFAVGGPLGAIIGTAAGHASDKQQSLAGAPDEFNRAAAFSIAVVVLGAKMANKKLAAINNAYDQICKQRSLN